MRLFRTSSTSSSGSTRADRAAGTRSPRVSRIRVASACLLVASLILLAAGAPANAQDGSAVTYPRQLPAPTPADKVVKGAANGWSQAVSVGVNTGAVSLGVGYGRSVAQYTDITPSSEGRAIDLGLIASIVGFEQCDGTPPMFEVDTLPPMTLADANTPGAATTGVTAAVKWPALAGKKQPQAIMGNQTAFASDKPWAKSQTDIVTSDLVFVKVHGAKSWASAEFSGGVRIAKAESSASLISLMGGVVEIKNPKWYAEKRSGAEESETATFTFERMRLFGVEQNPSNANAALNSFKGAVQQLLGVIGLRFEIPKVTAPANGDGISISPMAFKLTNAPLGKQLLTPLLTSEFMEQVRTDTLAEDCKREIGWLLIDQLESALAGVGSVDILVGGASATTDPTDFSFKPFPEDQNTDTPTDTGGSPTETANLGGEFGTEDFVTDDIGLTDDFGMEDFSGMDDFSSDSYGDDFGDTGFTPDGDFASDTTASGDDPDLEEIATGASSGGGGSSSAGPAVVVGLLALLGALGMSMGDRLMGRRNRRKIA